jgi:hypothetical protein
MADFGRRKGGAALVLALARGLSVAKAAESAGLSERTVHRRLQDPGFRQQINEVRATLVERAAGRLAGGMTAAAATLTKLLTARSETVRLGSARALLELAVKIRESVELESRILALEQRQSK